MAVARLLRDSASLWQGITIDSGVPIERSSKVAGERGWLVVRLLGSRTMRIRSGQAMWWRAKTPANNNQMKKWLTGIGRCDFARSPPRRIRWRCFVVGGNLHRAGCSSRLAVLRHERHANGADHRRDES